MKTLAIRFDATGEGHCLYTEALDLTAIGSLQIARTSNIEFNPSKQTWEVRGMEGQLLYTNASRDNCLEWEHQYFNR
jgi:hypothetical protein